MLYLDIQVNIQNEEIVLQTQNTVNQTSLGSMRYYLALSFSKIKHPLYSSLAPNTTYI